MGVDGFRFDVASTIPSSFFKLAREELGKDVFMVAESVDPGFGKYLQSVNAIYEEDRVLCQYFDCLYNYNWLDEMIKYLKGSGTRENVFDAIKNDDPSIVRLNCIENHDKDRIASYFDSIEKAKGWAKFSFSLKGVGFIYAGQEYGISHKPELFEKDPIVWPKENEIYSFYKSLIREKHQQEERENDICYTNDKVILNGQEYDL